MKHSFILLAFIFFMTSSNAFAVPDNIQVGEPTFTVYDSSYNIALRNKLEDDYHKKYTVKIDENHYVDTSPMGAYGREVLRPYAIIKKPYEFTLLPQCQDNKKSKQELLKEVNEDIAYYWQLDKKFHETCDSGEELYKKKLAEFKKAYGFPEVTQFHRTKIANEMRANGTMCGPMARVNMYSVPMEEWHKRKNKK